jgi:hypothetical protein
MFYCAGSSPMSDLGGNARSPSTSKSDALKPAAL